MRNDFLTIPDAPNYEINSEFVCRNKKTGRILKPMKDKRGKPCYRLRRVDGKVGCRSVKFLRRLAVAAVEMNSTFQLIPSLDYRYEINSKGIVRNAVTKKILKTKHSGKCVNIQFGGKCFSCAIADLLWEVHGRIIKRKYRPCPCSAENDTGKFFFPHMQACARFLAPKVFLSVGYIACSLARRKPIIEGWKITYYEQNPDNVKWDIDGLARLARRQQKLDKATGA